MPDSRDARDPVDHLRPAQVLPAQDVALTRAPALARAQVPVRHVLDVDDVRVRVDDRGQPAAQVVGHDARRRLAGPHPVERRAEDVRGTCRDHIDAEPPTGGERRPLALVLGVGVEQAGAALRIRIALGRSAIAGRRPDRRHAGGDDDSRNSAVGGRLDSDPGPDGVHAPHLAPRTGGHHARGVEQHVAAVQRAPHRAPVEDVGVDHLDVEAGQRRDPAPVAHGHPHLVAALHQAGRHVGADESRRARDAGLHGRLPAPEAGPTEISMALALPLTDTSPSDWRFLDQCRPVPSNVSGESWLNPDIVDF